MARLKKVTKAKSAVRNKRERKDKKEKKDKKDKKGKVQTKEHYDTLIIDGIGYKTLFTNKYLKRKKYQTLDPNKITAFIPGTILEIFVKTGKKVMKGDDLLILEAMKMNNKIVAPHEAIIKKIYVKSGDMVTRNQLLIELKP